MKQYTIDFKNTRTYYEFFERIITGLDFPSWCGKNLDAIWDLMTTNIKVPAIIYIEGSETIHVPLKEIYSDAMELFNEAVKLYGENGSYLEIKAIKD